MDCKGCTNRRYIVLKIIRNYPELPETKELLEAFEGTDRDKVEQDRIYLNNKDL